MGVGANEQIIPSNSKRKPQRNGLINSVSQMVLSSIVCIFQVE